MNPRFLTLCVFALCWGAGCGAAQPAKAPPAPPTPGSGAALFGEKCGMCHREMGMGTGLLQRRVDPAQAKLEDRNDLTAEFVVQATRTGIGNMPRISRAEVSDAQLELIAHYLAKTGEKGESQ